MTASSFSMPQRLQKSSARMDVTGQLACTHPTSSRTRALSSRTISLDSASSRRSSTTAPGPFAPGPCSTFGVLRPAAAARKTTAGILSGGSTGGPPPPEEAARPCAEPAPPLLPGDGEAPRPRSARRLDIVRAIVSRVFFARIMRENSA